MKISNLPLKKEYFLAMKKKNSIKKMSIHLPNMDFNRMVHITKSAKVICPALLLYLITKAWNALLLSLKPI